MIIFSNTISKQALKICESLKEKLKNTDIAGINFTFSAGIAEYKKGESMDEFIKRADNALYEAKINRNNICINDE